MLYNEFQNPFFPFFNAVFKSPWFPPVNMRDQIHTMGQTFFSILMLPLMTIGHSMEFPVVGNCSFTDFRFLIFFVLLIGLCFRLPFKRYSPIRNRTKFIILFALSSYISWVFMFSIIRYIVPIENIFGVLFVLAGFYERKSKFVLSVSFACFLLLSFTPLFSKPWNLSSPTTEEFIAQHPDQKKHLQTVSPSFNIPELSEDVLILLLNSPTSEYFVHFAKKYPKARAISFYAPELLLMGTNGSITEYGKFKELRNKIINEHTGDILSIMYHAKAYNKTHLNTIKNIMKDGDCFHPETFVMPSDSNIKLELKNALFCKISKKSVLPLNEE